MTLCLTKSLGQSMLINSRQKNMWVNKSVYRIKHYYMADNRTIVIDLDNSLYAHDFKRD